MKKTPEEIESGLAQFYGTEGYTRLSPLHGRLVCTDGVVWLAENAECFWLIDAIASYQRDAMKDESLQSIQFWKLTVKDRLGILICERDEGDVAFTQTIRFTNFPLPEIKIWVEAGSVGDKPVMVCLLPSEH
jgi:hypothetical protein